MKIQILTCIILMSILSASAQITNSFPNNGNVGVGTVNPETKMHIVKDNVGVKSTYSDFVLEAIDSQIDIISNSSGIWGSAINLIEGNTSSNSNVWSIVRQTTAGYGDSSLRFNFGNANWHDNPNKVIFKTNGNVGIGTTSPDAKLAVNGDIHAKEVKVDLIGWPDYVFEKGHKTPTLEEVEKHIQEKGHLINIPSAKEVGENGIQLGEMNKLLLEKIEELTLYTLQQQRELEKQKASKQKLEERLDQLENTLKRNEKKAYK